MIINSSPYTTQREYYLKWSKESPEISFVTEDPHFIESPFSPPLFGFIVGGQVHLWINQQGAILPLKFADPGLDETNGTKGPVQLYQKWANEYFACSEQDWQRAINGTPDKFKANEAISSSTLWYEQRLFFDYPLWMIASVGGGATILILVLLCICCCCCCCRRRRKKSKISKGGKNGNKKVDQKKKKIQTMKDKSTTSNTTTVTDSKNQKKKPDQKKDEQTPTTTSAPSTWWQPLSTAPTNGMVSSMAGGISTLSGMMDTFKTPVTTTTPKVPSALKHKPPIATPKTKTLQKPDNKK